MTDTDGSKPAATPKETGRLRALWDARGEVLRAWLVFGGSLAVMIQVLIWARPFTDTVFTRWIATYTAWVLALLGLEGESRGTLILSSIGSVEIIRECTAVYPTAMILAAVFAYKASWQRKLLGVVGGIVAIQCLNVIRIVSLMFVQKHWPESFEYMHMVVWQSLIVFLTGLLWLLWSTEFAQPRKRHAG
jgi:exosortase/archaeosortase family protein